MSPTINPFEIPGIAQQDTSPAALAVKEVVAHQLFEALEEVIGGGQRGEFTRNMETVLLPSIQVLLDYPSATLRELTTHRRR
jgi:hypothetical protein